jgi:predicted permease
MDFIREWLRRVWYRLNKRRFDEALRREMEAHRAEMGRPAHFGNTLRLREQAQDVWGWRSLDHLARDLALSVRTLRRSPLFAGMAALVLALGVGVNLAFFQLVNAMLLQPYPVKDPGTLAWFTRVCCWRDSTSSMTTIVPLPMAEAIGRSDVLAAVLAKRGADVAWGPDGLERARVAFVSSNWFDELGATAAVGRLFHARDPLPSDSPAAVLSHDSWQRDFAGRGDIVGEIVYVNDRPLVVIGVADRQFADVDLPVPAAWIPMTHVDAFFPTGSRFAADWDRGAVVYGRFAADLSPSAVADGLRSTLEGLSRERPDDVRAGEFLQLRLASDRFMEPRERAQALQIVAAAGALTALVLLVAALNLGNLMLARAIGRVREMSIRSALGASRWHVMRHLGFEGVLMAVAGGALGLGVAWLASRIVERVDVIPRGTDLTPDWRTAVFCVAAIAATALVVSVPAAWRVGRRDLSTAVRDGGERATAGIQSTRLRVALVACQLAGCAVLLVFAGQVLRGLDRLAHAALGYEFERVAVLEPWLGEYGVGGAAAAAYWTSVKDRLQHHPDVDAVALATLAPLGNGRSTSSYAPVPHLTIDTLNVEPSFFPLMRIPVRFGRSFAAGDVPGQVIIVSETVAREMYGRANVVGESFPKDQRGRTIVGVAGDAHLFTPHATNTGEAYGLIDPASPDAEYAVLVARARADVTRLPAALRHASRGAAEHLSPATRLLRTDFAARTSGPRLASLIGALTAVSALALAAVGISGVVAYAARGRYKEMGIRMALGATRTSIVRALFSPLAWTSGAGAALGLAGGSIAGHLFAGQPLYLDARDVLPYAAAAALLALSAGCAALWPAIRLLRADPLRALRID